MEISILELAQLTLIEDVEQSASKAIEESYEAAWICASDFIYN